MWIETIECDEFVESQSIDFARNWRSYRVTLIVKTRDPSSMDRQKPPDGKRLTTMVLIQVALEFDELRSDIAVASSFDELVFPVVELEAPF